MQCAAAGRLALGVAGTRDVGGKGRSHIQLTREKKAYSDGAKLNWKIPGKYLGEKIRGYVYGRATGGTYLYSILITTFGWIIN